MFISSEEKRRLIDNFNNIDEYNNNNFKKYILFVILVLISLFLGFLIVEFFKNYLINNKNNSK